MEFEKAFSLIVLSLTAWSAVALMLDRRGYAKINRWFAAFLFCLCVPQVYFYSCLLQPPNGIFFLALLTQATIWLKGPVIYAMVSLAFKQGLGRYWLHLLPFTFVALALMVNPVWMFEWLLGGFLHVMVYLFICWKMLYANRARLQIVFSGYQNSAIFWIFCVVLGMSILIVLDAGLMFLAYLQRSFLPTAIKLMNWIISFYLLALAFFSIYRPELFFHQSMQESAEKNADEENSIADERADEITASEVSLKTSGLTLVSDASVKQWRELNESLATVLAEKLTCLMQQEEIYRQNELSLTDLSVRLDISVHQTSELLNVHFAESFYDYLNRYRLAYACKLLADANCHLRVLDIAFESGFSNKNSFYRYFRETYGVTPVEYRSRQLDQPLTASH
jgi:AraC-like DNA-binding protein